MDARSDVYALGCVVYEMLAGTPPFTGPTAQSILARHAVDPVPRLRTVRTNVSLALEQAVERALAKVPADRFASAAALAHALETLPTAADVERVSPKLTTMRIGLPVGLAILTAALAVGVWWGQVGSRPSIPQNEGLKRLAVLPFTSPGDSSAAYLAEGVAAEIRGKLAALSGLAVIASTSSEQYRRTTKSPRDVARELGVKYLLVGRLQRAQGSGKEERVRVTPELVDATTGTTTWQQSFDAPLTDLFDVQASISGRVAEALGVALEAPARRELSRRPTVDLAAYDAFLRGQDATAADAWDPPTLRRAIAFYEQAVALDSTFAPAWARLARTRGRLHFVRTPGSEVSALSVRAAAERATALAPGRADSYLAWGGYLSLAREDFAGALQAYQAGLRAAPNNADLLTQAGTMEYYLGRWEAAAYHVRRAKALDPRAVGPRARLADALLSLRQWPQAREEATAALALAPGNLDLLLTKVETYLGEGDLGGARAAFGEASRVVDRSTLVAQVGGSRLYWLLNSGQRKALLHLPVSAFDGDQARRAIAFAQVHALAGDQRRVRLYADSARIASEEQLRQAPQNPEAHTTLGLSLAYLGRKADAVGEGQQGAELNSKDLLNQPDNEYRLARIYLLVGDSDKAVGSLDRMLRRDCFLSPGWLRLDPTFAALGGHQGFEQLRRGRH